MGLFGGGRDWNVIAVIFERDNFFRVNGNRSKGKTALKTRDGAKNHGRTIYWAVFDQKGKFLEGDPGPGVHFVTPETMQRLVRDMPTNATVLEVLRRLESGENEKAAKGLVWGGYPEVAE